MLDTVKPRHCARCEEPIEPGEEQGGIQYPMHPECFFRTVMGCVAHIERRCSCFVPGSHDHDPEGMTLREGARAAVKAWEKRERRKLPDVYGP